MSDADQKVRDLLGLLGNAQLSDDEQDLLVHGLLARFNRTAELTALLNAADDRAACNQKITNAVKLVRGPNFGFSGHGIIRTISGRFSDEQKAAIVRKMYAFSCLLRENLNIQSFITSGTLLGLIRENRFLPHDDDFDMAYISAFMDRMEILKERRRIFECVNASEEFLMKERTGGRAAVFVTSPEVNFNFDLFVGYRHKEFFNEFPLKPEAMKFHDISPVQVMTFYGEDIFVPKSPEALLEVNYGKGWKQPDPSFRFAFGEHRKYYHFLIANTFEDLVEPQ